MLGQAVLWDMDGLLVDSEPVWTVAQSELAAQLGGVWSPELKDTIMGTRLEVAVPAMLRWYGAPTTADRVDETSRWLLARMVTLFGDGLLVRPGARQLLAAVAAVGVPQALVSSSFRVLVEAVLAGLGEHPFAVTLAGDEVVQAKPDPEPYLTAAARLGVDPTCCVVLEDSPSGVAAGEAAGCRVVAVPDGAMIPAVPGRLVVASLAELTPAVLGLV